MDMEINLNNKSWKQKVREKFGVVCDWLITVILSLTGLAWIATIVFVPLIFIWLATFSLWRWVMG